MGAGFYAPIASYHTDRAGTYTIDETFDKRVYKWFQNNNSIQIAVFVEDKSVRAQLIEFNAFKIRQDDCVEIIVNENIEIKDVYINHKGMSSESVAKTMFCAIRTYVERIGNPVLYGNVTVTSKNAKAAFRCYKSAFAKNGFETESTLPSVDVINQWTIHFIKSIKKPLKLAPLF
jgi:hypothetical protein|tara:strand:- start:2972 stop:3496 length:525 start_codon:yes stop_codon:yes gene_type:complete